MRVIYEVYGDEISGEDIWKEKSQRLIQINL